MYSEIKTIEYLLVQWGILVRKNEVDLGFAHISPHERLRHGMSPDPNISPEEDAQIDQAMNALKLEDPMACDAIILVYTKGLPYRITGKVLAKKYKKPTAMHAQTVSNLVSTGRSAIKLYLRACHDKNAAGLNMS